MNEPYSGAIQTTCWCCAPCWYCTNRTSATALIRPALASWCDNSSKFRPVLPKLAQWLAGGAAHKDIGVIQAFLIGHAQSVGRVASKAAIDEKLIGAFV
jgi:hypothetical protein